MGKYPTAEELVRPVLRVAMPRPPRLHAPGATVHVVARCNNHEFYINAPEDFKQVLSTLGEMLRTYAVTLYAYTVMSNHVHLMLLVSCVTQMPSYAAPPEPVRLSPGCPPPSPST